MCSPLPKSSDGPQLSQGYSAAISLPKKRQGYGCAALSDGRVFVCGGRNGKSIYSDAYLISPQDNTFTQVSVSRCLMVRLFSHFSCVTLAVPFLCVFPVIPCDSRRSWSEMCTSLHARLCRLACCVQKCVALLPHACDSTLL